MKKFLKAGVSMLAAAALLAGIRSEGIPADSVYAAEEYTNWTYASASVSDGKADGGYVEKAALLNEQGFQLGNTKFSGYVNFSHADSGVHVAKSWGYPSLSFGATAADGSWTSKLIKFGLVTIEGNTYLSGAMSQTYGWIFRDKPISPNTDILLQVTFDYVAKDADGIKNDLQLHVWIDGTPVSTVQQAWDNWATVTGEDICIKDYADSKDPVMAHIMLYAQGTNQEIAVRSVYGVTVSGLENNKTYCDSVSVTVATAAADGTLMKDLDKVTVGKEDINLTNGSFTIPAGTGKTTVVVTDKTGVSQTYTVTVNDGHSWSEEYFSNKDATYEADGTKSRKCLACGVMDSEKVKDEGSKLTNPGTSNGETTPDKVTPNTGEGSPNTGEGSLSQIMILFMAVSAVTMAVILKRTKMEK